MDAEFIAKLIDSLDYLLRKVNKLTIEQKGKDLDTTQFHEAEIQRNQLKKMLNRMQKELESDD